MGSNYGLDNVYQETPAGRQIEVQGVAPGQMATYTVRIQNDGNVTRTFTLRAEREGASGWVSDYMVDGKRIAAAVEGPDGYTTRGMAPGATLDVTVMLAPTTMAVGGSTAGITLKAFLHRNDVVVRDAVQAVATVPVLRRGDLMLKRGTNTDSAYSGDSIYQSMPSGIQVLRQIVRPGGRVSFTVKMENDGNMAMPFVVSAQGSSGGGWTVSYRRGSLDVSTLILGQTGYTTETLAVGTSVLFTIEMTRGWNALPTSGRTATLRVGQWAGWPMDTVSAVASALGTTGPDLLLKAGGGDEGKFAVDDVYQGTPFASQIVSQSVAAGGTATYQAMVHNDAGTPRSFTARAVESGRPGWRTTYRVGSRNITGRLTSQEGYATPAIAAGGHLIVVVAVTPPAGAAAGSQRTTCLRVFTTGEDTAPQDAVRATTRAVAAARKRY